MYELGEEMGLSGGALDTFAYALYEVELTLKIDTNTGTYEIIDVKG